MNHPSHSISTSETVPALPIDARERVSLTERAAHHILRYLSKRGKGEGIALGVKKTGCSGLAYTLEFVDTPSLDHLIFESFGAKVFVSPEHLVYLKGLLIDFTREGLQEGFKFSNPNEKARCGCGESFTIDSDKASN
jgi:iron-sulfur cluster assembly protein